MQSINNLKNTLLTVLENKEECTIVNKKDNLSLAMGIIDYQNNDTLYLLVSDEESDIDYHYFESCGLNLNGEFLNLVHAKYSEFIKKYNFNNN